jgi:predicted dehydrogenase
MVLNAKQRQIGSDNFNDASREVFKITRRQLLSAAAVIPSAAAMYWGYTKLKGAPVKAGLIGTGNQGCYAHISQSNPEYIEFVAFSDIRPSNQARARDEFKKLYGPEKAAKIKLYEEYYKLLDDPDVELVIIALPLHLHAEVAIAALQKGKHVLCEKLMARTVTECKRMIKAADAADRFLAIGHQRHYSYMYANALSLIQQGVVGDIRHIHAYWHRNQTASDSWSPPVPDEDKNINIAKYQYDSLEQLIRWRIDRRTGGGLMVELGSHQLDAASIFLKHKLPTEIVGTGVTSYFKDGRDIPDHVFMQYLFGDQRVFERLPGHHAAASTPAAASAPAELVLPLPYTTDNAVVTYSSISTNACDGYGEQVNGSRATLIMDREAESIIEREIDALGDRKLEAHLFFEDFKDKARDTRVDTRMLWAEGRIGKPVMASGGTAAWGSGAGMPDTLTSRGYREEQEHLAWLIREVGKPDPSRPEMKPRCDGRVALADAVVALCSNLAMDKKKRIVMNPKWFDPADDANPESEV